MQILQSWSRSIARFSRGTTTPLASIFGSGFLIIIPVLDSTVGPYSVLAMIGVCALAYAVGAVIRHNIREVEPLLKRRSARRLTRLFERIADIALIPAYVISITLYLRILSAYGLGFLNIDSEYNEKILTTAIIAFILFIGVTKGLRVLEGLEKWALITTMIIIFLMIASFAIYDIDAFASGSAIISDLPNSSPWDVITVLAGTLIVVQGFETTRYLGDEYDMETRIRACRNSQIISTVVYLSFVAVALPLAQFLPEKITGNELIDLAAVVALWLPAPLVLAAVFSQFSAATADTIGASGNILEFVRHRLSEKLTYLLICGAAILLTWVANTMEILSLASRAFAFYYFMQCLVALSIAKSAAPKAGFSVIGAALLFITIFAVPVG